MSLTVSCTLCYPLLQDCLTHDLMPQDVIDGIYFACWYDVCLTESSLSMCDHADTLISSCLALTGVQVKDWREESFCRKWGTTHVCVCGRVRVLAGLL